MANRQSHWMRFVELFVFGPSSEVLFENANLKVYA